jgi:hypothetical protein
MRPQRQRLRSRTNGDGSPIVRTDVRNTAADDLPLNMVHSTKPRTQANRAFDPRYAAAALALKRTGRPRSQEGAQSTHHLATINSRRYDCLRSTHHAGFEETPRSPKNPIRLKTGAAAKVSPPDLYEYR